MSKLAINVHDAVKKADIDIDCPNCRKDFLVVVAQVGGYVECPFCKKRINLIG